MSCDQDGVVFFSIGYPCSYHINLNSWLLQWLTCSDQLAQQMFCRRLWKIWKTRNNTGFYPIEVAVSTAEFILVLQRECLCAQPPLRPSPNLKVVPTSHGSTKINVDTWSHLFWLKIDGSLFWRWSQLCCHKVWKNRAFYCSSWSVGHRVAPSFKNKNKNRIWTE